MTPPCLMTNVGTTSCSRCNGVMASQYENIDCPGRSGDLLIDVLVYRCSSCRKSEIRVPALDKLTTALDEAHVRMGPGSLEARFAAGGLIGGRSIPPGWRIAPRRLPPVHVRLFVRALPKVNGMLPYWAARGLEYLETMAQRDFDFCAVSTLRGGADFTDSRSPWSAHARRFSRQVHERRYVNVIVGDNGDVHGLYTVGVPNVAITGVMPRSPTPSELASLMKFDAVFCPMATDAMALQGLGLVKAQFAPAHSDLFLDTIRKHAHDQASLAVAA